MLTPAPTKPLAESRLDAALDLLIAYLLEQSDLSFENEPVTDMAHPEGDPPDAQPVQ